MGGHLGFICTEGVGIGFNALGGGRQGKKLYFFSLPSKLSADL